MQHTRAAPIAIDINPIEREEISRGVVAGASIRAIATTLGRGPSTISREIRRNDGPQGYRASQADQAAWARGRRPRSIERRRDVADMCGRRTARQDRFSRTTASPAASFPTLVHSLATLRAGAHRSTVAASMANERALQAVAAANDDVSTSSESVSRATVSRRPHNTPAICSSGTGTAAIRGST